MLSKEIKYYRGATIFLSSDDGNKSHNFLILLCYAKARRKIIKKMNRKVLHIISVKNKVALTSCSWLIVCVWLIHTTNVGTILLDLARNTLAITNHSQRLELIIKYRIITKFSKYFFV